MVSFVILGLFVFFGYFQYISYIFDPWAKKPYKSSCKTYCNFFVYYNLTKNMVFKNLQWGEHMAHILKIILTRGNFLILHNKVFQKALGGICWNKLFSTPLIVLFKTHHCTLFENCQILIYFDFSEKYFTSEIWKLKIKLF